MAWRMCLVWLVVSLVSWGPCGSLGTPPPSAPAVLPAQGLDQALGGLQPAEESDGFNEEALDVASRPETVEEENEVLFRDACFFALNFKPRTPKTQEEGMPYESMLDCSEFPDFEFTIRRSFPLLMTQAPEMSLRARAIHACQVVANRIPFPSWDEFWPKDPRDKTRWCDENQAMYILPIPTATPHT